MTSRRDFLSGTPHAEFSGLRITPNVYTTVDEIDTFGDKMLEAVRKGIS